MVTSGVVERRPVVLAVVAVSVLSTVARVTEVVVTVTMSLRSVQLAHTMCLLSRVVAMAVGRVMSVAVAVSVTRVARVVAGVAVPRAVARAAWVVARVSVPGSIAVTMMLRTMRMMTVAVTMPSVTDMGVVSDSGSMTVLMDMVNLYCGSMRMTMMGVILVAWVVLMGVSFVTSAPATVIFKVSVLCEVTMRVFGIVHIVMAWRVGMAAVLVTTVSVMTLVAMANGIMTRVATA